MLLDMYVADAAVAICDTEEAQAPSRRNLTYNCEMNRTVWQRCSFKRSLTLSMNLLQSCGSGPLDTKQPLILQASNLKAEQLQSGNAFLNVKIHAMFNYFQFCCFNSKTLKKKKKQCFEIFTLSANTIKILISTRC